MEAFARSMDNYFAVSDDTPSSLHKKGGISGRGVRHYSRNATIGSSLGFGNSNSPAAKMLSNLAVSHLVYYITLTTLMDMSLQFAYPSNATQHGFSVWCLFINSIQVIAYLGAVGLMLYLSVKTHQGAWFKDIIVQMPFSLLLVGYMIALSILINSSNYNKNLTIGSNIVLNFPRVVFIICIMIYMHSSEQWWKTLILVVLFILAFTTGCLSARHSSAKSSHALGIVGFIAGLGSLVLSVWLDLETGGGIRNYIGNYKMEFKKNAESTIKHVQGMDLMNNVSGNTTGSNDAYTNEKLYNTNPAAFRRTSGQL